MQKDMLPSLHYKEAISEHWRQKLFLIKRAEFNLCLLKQFCLGRKGKTRHTTGLSIKMQTCNATQLILLKARIFHSYCKRFWKMTWPILSLCTLYYVNDF